MQKIPADTYANGYDVKEWSRGYYAEILTILDKNPEGMTLRELGKPLESKMALGTIRKKMYQLRDQGALTVERLGTRKNSDLVIKPVWRKYQIDDTQEKLKSNISNATGEVYLLEPPDEFLAMIQGLEKYSKEQQIIIIPFLMKKISTINSDRWSVLLDDGKEGFWRYHSMLTEKQLKDAEESLNEYIDKKFNKKQIEKIRNYYNRFNELENNRIENIYQNIEKLFFLPSLKEFNYFATLQTTTDFKHEEDISYAKKFINNPDDLGVDSDDIDPKILKKLQTRAKTQLDDMLNDLSHIERPKLNKKIDQFVKQHQILINIQDEILKEIHN
jgi:hypothetical protein